MPRDYKPTIELLQEIVNVRDLPEDLRLADEINIALIREFQHELRVLVSQYGFSLNQVIDIWNLPPISRYTDRARKPKSEE